MGCRMAFAAAGIRNLFAFGILTLLACSGQPPEEARKAPSPPVPWESGSRLRPEPDTLLPVAARIPHPAGYRRSSVAPGSFGAWLRALRVRAGRPPVYLFDGRRKANQSAHYAVLDVDIGDKDLQQCADAVIRLRAEFLFSSSCRDEIGFHFTSGDLARWRDWREGLRPVVTGNRVTWRRTGNIDPGYANFRAYLETVFMYAGSASLAKEMKPVPDARDIRIGDVFIEGGFPGHAVLVVDVVENPSGERAFLLAQSFMPAQDIHILRSFEDISPWYRARSEGVLRTPEWNFLYGRLRRFSYSRCISDGGHPVR